MAKVFITRAIPEAGPQLLRDAGHEVVVSEKEGVLTKEELVAALKEHNPDAVLCLLTDKVDGEIFDAAPNAKMFANYAVGFDNIDVGAATEKGVTITNTPGVLTDTVAEHAVALIFASAKRIAEADRFTRAGKYVGWEPMLLLGADLRGKTLGILGAGRIGSRVAEILGKGVGMNVIYYDIKKSEPMEKATGATFKENIDDVLSEADFVSVHVPLLDSTKHLINAERLSKMKKTAILVNTSRGAVIDETALVEALKSRTIRSAAMDVYEDEPTLKPGLSDLDNVTLTPHTASGTEETRGKMAEIAAQNIIAHVKGETPPDVVQNK